MSRAAFPLAPQGEPCAATFGSRRRVRPELAVSQLSLFRGSVQTHSQLAATAQVHAEGGRALPGVQTRSVTSRLQCRPPPRLPSQAREEQVF